jgi:hypothetical protein
MGVAVVPLLLLAGFMTMVQSGADVAPLTAMVEAEHAFAARAREKGVRDAFLEFLTPAAIMLSPDPVRAHDVFGPRPSVPFSAESLVWEPRLGDVAASGELGWLTGPSTFVLASSPTPTPRYANYVSVWKRQGDGAWRVILDVGTVTPSSAEFAPGFNRFPMRNRGTPRAATAVAFPLAEADRALNETLEQRGMRDGYATVLLDATRLHRSGMLPIEGRDAVLAWVAAKRGRYTGLGARAEAAASDDLGYSYGSYGIKGPEPEAGSYLRIWHRDAGRRWRLVLDLAQVRVQN